MTEDPQVRPPDIWGDRPPPGPVPDTGAGRPLDLSQDPDRFVPDAAPGTAAPEVVAPPVLDPARDPDRFDRTLTEMLGEGAQEEDRDGYVWLAGLLSVLAFLALVAFVASRLGP